jgi:hypothetical protein
MISRRTFGIGVVVMAGDGLVKPVNAPAGQSTPVGVQPGVSNGIVIARKVIIIGNTGGLFVYAPGPGPGNLIASIAAEAGTDQYGNSYPGGILGSLETNEIQFLSGASVVGQLAPVTLGSGLALDLSSIAFNSTAGTAAAPTIITTDVWQTMTLLNGWSVGSGGYAQYKMEPNLRVSVRAANLVVGTVTAGTSIWTPPAAYAPTVTQRIEMIIENSTGAAVTETPRADVSAAGFAVENFPLNTTRVGFNSSYALDL